MQYQINRDNYHRFDTIEINKLPPRSYFIPFSTRDRADGVTLKEKRYRSDKVTCLNGTWDFQFYPRPKELPALFDTDAARFDPLDVPSCWQFRGYDRPFYVNTRYQFPFNPPDIPQEEPVGKVFSWGGSDTGIRPVWHTPEDEYNFVGVYRKKLQIADSEKRHILSFLGVASCIDLYVNGSFVGYSEGSHNAAEFDMTPFQHQGENELVAVVHRWCTGTYLECQDMFRNNGIFRDVLLYRMEKNDIWDVDFSARKGEQGYTATASAQVQGEGTVKITLSGHGLLREQTVKAEGGKASAVFEDLQVREWNAESPALYDLYFQMDGTCVKLRVGFRHVKIQGDIFTLNGNKLKLHGVNHHDTSSRNGYCLTPDEIERDILLCKQYNIDTIRTSHYPPDPLLLELCDEMGIYVVDEADLETHGALSQQMPPNYNSLTQDKRWEPRYLDRARRLYGRDKTHPCILMWSLGNEAGGYRNTDAMYAYLKGVTDLPIHYERVIDTKRVAYDVGSEMYPPVEDVALVGQHRRKKKQLNDRPYFMCEYAHAMGAGPGAAEAYWKEIYQYDNLMGGCVWEMVDHAVLHPDGSYTYGGDHGEWEHDSNFCVDGLFYPDRTPSTGAKCIRFLYRPLRVRYVSGCQYEVFNTRAFTDASHYALQFCFSDGRKVTTAVAVPPLTRKTVEIPDGQASGESVTVIVKEGDREVSREQILFDLQVQQETERLPGLPLNLDIRDGVVTVQKDGKRLCSSVPYTILFRAPTDNDKDFSGKSLMDDFIPQTEEVLETQVGKNQIQVKTRIRCKKHVFLCTDTYESCPQGILVTSQLRCTKGGGNLPRFGKAFRLDGTFDWVEYQGRNGESYCDMKEHTQIEQVRCTVADMTEPNIRPQESGNRCDCTFAQLSDGKTAFTFTAVERSFELGIKPYSDRELLTMRHREDEKQSGTYVTLSAFQMGIGTGSCGPSTMPEYCYPVKQDYTLRFIIG